MAETAQTCDSDLIRHPVWCRHVPDDAPYAGDPVGAQSYYDRMAPVDPLSEHEGREYRLDAGSHFGYGITVQATQNYERATEGVHNSEAEVRLSLVNHDLVGAPQAVWLRAHEVETLISMLQTAVRDMVL